MLAFVPALGPIAGALIGEFWGWQAIFITLAALASLALLNASFRWHETDRWIRPERNDLFCRSSRVRPFGFTRSVECRHGHILRFLLDSPVFS